MPHQPSQPGASIVRPLATLGMFGLVLAVAFGGGAAAGSLTGPIDVGDGGAHPDDDAPGAALPARGLLVAQDGLRLVPDARSAHPGPFSFRIVGDDDRPVVDFVEQHERYMHFIVASRDLATFHHLHPTRDAGGRWQVDLPELSPGAYRAFADFQADGAAPMTLGVDLTVPGRTPRAQPPAPTTTHLVDGYDVRLEGELVAGTDAELTITVRRGGAVVSTEPYLGAGGHLVALRDGDLAFLHVHPLDEHPEGPVRFAVDVPSEGTYALFFDFVHDGEVRTARFVVDADRTAPPSDPSDGDGH